MKAIFLGGDSRQKYACEYLNIYNIPSEFYEDFENRLEDKIKNASIVALPIPILKDEMNLNTKRKTSIHIGDILELIDKGSIVFGGKFNDYIKEANKSVNLLALILAKLKNISKSTKVSSPFFFLSSLTLLSFSIISSSIFPNPLIFF